MNEEKKSREQIILETISAITAFAKDKCGEMLAYLKEKRDNVNYSRESLKKRREEIEILIREKDDEEAKKKDEEKQQAKLINAERAELLKENQTEEAPDEDKKEAVADETAETVSVAAETKAPEMQAEKSSETAVTATKTEESAEEKKKPSVTYYVPPTEPQRQRPQRQYLHPSGEISSVPPQRYQGGANADRRPQRPQMQPQMPVQQPTGRGGDKRRNAPQQNDKRSIFDDRKGMSRKSLQSKGFIEDTSSAIEYDEITGEIIKVRTRRSGGEKAKKNVQAAPQIEFAVMTTPTITVKQLSEKIGKTGPEIIKRLFELGYNKTINDFIDYETAALAASDLGVTLELKLEQTSEEKLIQMHDAVQDKPEDLVVRPPIVTIMGHVDHGKTSILDYIRKSKVAAGEAGGITQHIGAYTIQTKDGIITFLDTPGHEAFTAMRARGANVTDIVVIVVAADDGIMPQTVEAINHAKAAGVEIIIAVNKIDTPHAMPDKVLKQLMNYEIFVEEYGGTVPAVKVSAKTGENIDQLLSTIQLVAEMSELKANPKRLAKGAIIEARLDKGKGPVATVLVQNGTLKVGDYFIAGTVTGKVRAMFSETGKMVKTAGPSIPVSVLGFQEVPNAGDLVMATDDMDLVKRVSESRGNKANESIVSNAPKSLDELFGALAENKQKQLNIILKADVQGSVEAVKHELQKLTNDEVKLNVIHSGVGAINESDVTLAKTAYTIIVGFNVRPDLKAKNEAEKAGIDLRTYHIIYEVVDDMTRALNGMLSPKFREQYLGRAEVRQVFKVSGVGNVAGCMVKDGKIVRGAKVRLLRDNVIVTEGEISSLKRMKDDVKEVNTNYECGIGLLNYDDIKVGDVFESYVLEREEA